MPEPPHSASPAGAGAHGQTPAGWLLAASAATVVLWQLPFGELLLYPFSILATWFHEMGHGLAAIVTGGDFQSLKMYADGSGVARSSGVGLGRLGTAIVAAAGPLGAPIAGAAFIVASRSAARARACLWILGIALLLSTALWVRSLFGVLVLPIAAIVVLGLAQGPPRARQALAVQILGANACLSAFRDSGYLFARQATVAGQTLPSDSGQIARALWLPYWFWGGLMAAGALALLGGAVWSVYGSDSMPQSSGELVP